MDLRNGGTKYITEVQLKGTTITPRRGAGRGHFTFCIQSPGMCQRLQGYPSSHERHQFPLSMGATITASLNPEWLSSPVCNSV